MQKRKRPLLESKSFNLMKTPVFICSSNQRDQFENIDDTLEAFANQGKTVMNLKFFENWDRCKDQAKQRFKYA